MVYPKNIDKNGNLKLPIQIVLKSHKSFYSFSSNPIYLSQIISPSKPR